jgi:hypothetical protein
MAWLRKDLESQISIAMVYMLNHAVIIRWTTALLALIEVLDPEVSLTLAASICVFKVSVLVNTTCELISSTLCLPNSIFCPIVLWAARRLTEDALHSGGFIDKRPARLIRDTCVAAISIYSRDMPGGYSQLIGTPPENRHRNNFRAGGTVPWPSLRRSFINCTAALARDIRELQQAYAVCRDSADERISIPTAFHDAMHSLQVASSHGVIHNYIHDFVVNFSNFSSEGFLSSVSLPATSVHGLWEWAAEGMICNSLSPGPTLWRKHDWEGLKTLASVPSGIPFGERRGILNVRLP